MRWLRLWANFPPSSPPAPLLAGGLSHVRRVKHVSTMWDTGLMDYRLQVEFTAKQRDHLDTKRAEGIPAGVYLRGLVNQAMAQAELSKGVGGINEAPPSHFTEAPPISPESREG